MTRTAVLLTLGHNSSAIYFDGEKACGFEEERLTRCKSESRYPINAIRKLESCCDIAPGSMVFVSHWFDTTSAEQVPDGKYFDRASFEEFVAKYDLVPEFVSTHEKTASGAVSSFTHHDAHCWSAMAFFWDKLTPEQSARLGTDDVHSIVLDGFGNHQEVLSVYRVPNGAQRGSKPELIRRVCGYESSMGLMYQYATSYCGMKENQDEYKFLGYESHVHEVISAKQLASLVETCSNRPAVFDVYFSEGGSEPRVLESTDGKGINLPSLLRTKEAWYSHFDTVLQGIGCDPNDMDPFSKRAIIGCYVQSVVEGVMADLTRQLNVKHVVTSGGVFYNVKLNNRLLKTVPGLFSVIPLAGDQGCAIGMYEHRVGGFRYGDLKWSPRSSMAGWESHVIDQTSGRVREACLASVRHFTDRAEFVAETSRALFEDNIVNIIDGPMEYGPRALCSTTTLARPSKRNIETINSLNARDTVMPMAPVIPLERGEKYFDSEDMARVVGSDRYMIVTYDYTAPRVFGFEGVAHAYPTVSPDVGKYSGRPQFICDGQGDRTMRDIFEAIPGDILVNTSFNAHGRPIVYEIADIIDSYVFQVDRALELGLQVPLLYLLEADDA